MNGLRRKINLLVVLLVLPVLARASAADDPHPLHGTWISQGGPNDDGSEWELALNPDGSFRMVVTAGEALYFDEAADGDLEDPDFDEAADGEEMDEEDAEEESWEDVLADLDSNDNGVIDEEDYQAAQARGDEDLPPTWDEVLEDDINGDGVLDEEEFGLLVEDDDDWEEVDPFGESTTELFGEEMVMTMIVTGTWEAQDDRFTLEPVETIVTINELTLAEFYTEIFNLMTDAIFEESGLSEDEFLAMIAEDEDTVAPETLDEWKATMVEELLTETDEVEAFETETFEYAINGDEMTTTDSGGDPLVFVRLDARSAVDAVSWGQIKAMQR